MKVSLVLTVLNEGNHVRRLFESIASQTRLPDEVVVCDGGSTDNTLEVIEWYRARLPIKLVIAPGANISQGRNKAIAAAAGEVIAVTDAGVWLDANWLHALLAAGNWLDTRGGMPSARVVAGFYRSDPQTLFERAMGATTIPLLGEINPATFLPSSRSVAFCKDAWAAVGGYPEWLDFSEDVVFDLALREKFGEFAFAPEAIAHFRPRGSVASFARQYFNYAKGDGKANLWLRIHCIRYFTYLVAVPLGVYAALAVSPWLWLLGALAGLAYIRRPLMRLGWRHVSAMGWIPVLRVVGDVAKMIGYPVGVWWRVTRRL